MKIFVCIKQVPDTEATIATDGDAIDESAVKKWILNPYDEFAVEEAVRIKEALGDVEVVAVSLGPERVKSAFHTALAMGADRGIHVLADEIHDPAQTAAGLAAAIQHDGDPTLVLTGILAIDDYACQVHLRLAQHLDAAAAINVTALDWTDQGARVTRSAGNGSEEILLLPAPAVVAATKGLNQPRYPTLPNIMKAQKKEIRQLVPTELGLDLRDPAVEVIGIEPPREFSGGKILDHEPAHAAAELVGWLHHEAQVI